jgi:hypothetical protein
MPNDERAKQLLQDLRAVDTAIDAAVNLRKLQLAIGSVSGHSGESGTGRACETVEQFEVVSLVRRFNTSSASRVSPNRRRQATFEKKLYK